jgi:hypothetical protein
MVMASRTAVAPPAGLGQERHTLRRGELLARTSVAIGCVAILVVAGFALDWLAGEQDEMKRESGTFGFALLVAVTVFPLVMALVARRRTTIWLAIALLAVASLMCLGPMAAWLQQLWGQVPELNLLDRQLVAQGLAGLAFGAVAVIGAVVCMVMSRSQQDM